MTQSSMLSDSSLPESDEDEDEDEEEDEVVKSLTASTPKPSPPPVGFLLFIYSSWMLIHCCFAVVDCAVEQHAYPGWEQHSEGWEIPSSCLDFGTYSYTRSLIHYS